jgi:hypothetical protein
VLPAAGGISGNVSRASEGGGGRNQRVPGADNVWFDIANGN